MKAFDSHVALGLSWIPGAGQVYLRQIQKGLSLMLIAAGIAAALVFSRSILIFVIAWMMYLILAIPAAIDAYSFAKWNKSAFDVESHWYVITMLLLTGMSALPLLWHSPRFSSNAKIAWTCSVVFLALIFFAGMTFFWSTLENLLII